MNERTILCYGDSNTWGWNPTTQDRYARHERWPGVLRQELGEGYLIIEEGLNGRTTVWDDPIEGYKNGKEYLVPCLETHKPVDLVIIMLGTNDLKMRFSVSAFDIAAGAGALVDIVTKSQAGPGSKSPHLPGTCPALVPRDKCGPPQVLLIAPPPIARLSDFAEMFEGGAAKSQKLAPHFRLVADEHGCAFLDAAQVIVSSDVDGVHLDPSEHRKLGKAVAAHVRQLLQA